MASDERGAISWKLFAVPGVGEQVTVTDRRYEKLNAAEVGAELDE